MGYLSIYNLYRVQDLLLFRRCYQSEKVHGTSAHIRYRKDATPNLTFFSGGETHSKFVALFDSAALLERFEKLGVTDITVYGEAYGGKQQGMSHTYGPNLCFIVFEVRVDDVWLAVPNVSQIADSLGLEMVPWSEISTDLDELNKYRDMPSEVAVRRGMGNDKKREGVVLRPLIELTKNNGERIIVKHKNEAFSERATPQKIVDVDKLAVLAEAGQIADEWVVEERLTHCIDHLKARGIPCDDMKHIGDVLKEMVEDVYREAKGEIVESKEARQAISKRTADMYKRRVMVIK